MGGAALGGLVAGPLGALAGGFLGGGQQQQGFGGVPQIDMTDVNSLRANIPGMEGSLKGDIAGIGANTNYQAKDYSGPLEGFEGIRQNLGNQLSAEQSTASDAMSRRFAAMGMQNSGAALKAGQNLDVQMAGERNNAMNNINFQEAQQRQQLNQAEAQRAFQSRESQRQMDLQGQEFNNENARANAQFKLGAEEGLANLSLGAQGMNTSNAINSYNMEMNRYQMQHSGGLLGSGGFLGTGIGGGMGGATGFGV